tara:strand:+ start:1825 stop:2427 length:603 start_codon:yes stop_codon:yes gene_type:complete
MNNTSSEINLIFSTPIWTSHLNEFQDVNKKMEEYIKKQMELDSKGKKASNINGWHSENFNLKDEEVVFFINTISIKIQKAMEDMGWDLSKNKIEIPNIWSIINKRGSSNAMHIHSNSYLSAAYYVKAPEKCGDIVFYDPRQSRLVRKPKISKLNNLNGEEVNIKPTDGLLVLFPSYLYHSVNENLSNKERIVISFNVDLK